ncbi:Hypothetical protein FKW44_018060, partial [Caligus rogercresseyi]
WLISTSSSYVEAFEIEHLISAVQRILYTSRVNGVWIPFGSSSCSLKKHRSLTLGIKRQLFQLKCTDILSDVPISPTMVLSLREELMELHTS